MNHKEECRERFEEIFKVIEDERLMREESRMATREARGSDEGRDIPVMESVESAEAMEVEDEEANQDDGDKMEVMMMNGSVRSTQDQRMRAAVTKLEQSVEKKKENDATGMRMKKLRDALLEEDVEAKEAKLGRMSGSKGTMGEMKASMTWC